MPLSLEEALCPACRARGAVHDRTILGDTLVRCRDCGLAYVFPRPTATDLAEFYAALALNADYYHGQSAFKAAFFELCYRKIEAYCPTGKLLDLGCGDCGFLNAGYDRGFELYGSDLNPEVAKLARGPHLKFLVGPLEEQGIADGAFDVVFTAATYEHLLDPAATTREIARILRPGGLLAMVSVPNYRALNIRLGLEDWMVNRPPAHINFFTGASLAGLIAANGFKIREQWTYGLNPAPLKRRLLGQTSNEPLLEWLKKNKPKDRGEVFRPKIQTGGARPWLLPLAYAYLYFNYFDCGDKLALIAERR